MSINTKLLSTVSLIAVVLFLVVCIAVGSVLFSTFGTWEKTDTLQKVRNARTALASEISAVNTLASDWAWWDDSYRFLEDGNEEFLQSNINRTTFAENRLNVIVLLNRSGNIVYRGAYDLGRKAFRPLPSGLLPYLREGSQLVTHRRLQSSLQGVLSLPEGTMIVSSWPVLTTEGKGPSAGCLVFGRFVDEQVLRLIASMDASSLRLDALDRVDTPDFPEFESLRRKLTVENSTEVIPLGHERVVGAALIKDVFEKPSLVISVVGPRDIYKHGIMSLKLMLFATGILCVLHVILTYVVITRKVLTGGVAASTNPPPGQ
jgi:sensor domain CHASE-containing protein